MYVENIILPVIVLLWNLASDCNGTIQITFL